MADPKYIGLPGIAVDEPDVYETYNLPESEQAYTIEGDTSETVEMLHISSNEAFSHFQHKGLDASRVDFSDRISRRKHSGYQARNIEWEIAGDGSKETVVQKYQRLKCETDELIEEIQQIKDDVTCGGGMTSIVDLKQQIEVLHSTLLNLKLQEQLGTDVVTSISDPQIAFQKKFLNLLENLKKTGLVTEKEKGSSVVVSSSSAAPVTYELYYAPEHTKLQQLSHLASLEKRITQLEALIGSTEDKMNSLSAWTNHKSVVGAIQMLSARMSLLEPTHLDYVEGRLHSIHTKMNAIGEKKNTNEDTDKQNKISELYEIMQKSEVLSAALSEVVERLVSIEALHEEAMQFSQSLRELDAAQTKLANAVGTNSEMLPTVQEKLTQNLKIIEKNVTSLEERIQAIQKST